MGISQSIQRLSLMYFSARAVRRPDELKNILRLAELLFSSGHLRVLKQHCQLKRPEMFVARPRFSPNLERLATLPLGTVGRDYFDFLKRYRIDPKDLQMPSRSYDPDELYLFQYFYETHDLFHLLTGFDTTIAGELGLQAFYLGQAPTPLAPLLVSIGTLREFWINPLKAESLLKTVFGGYALGTKATPLFGVDWEAELERPTTTIRMRYGLLINEIGSDLAA